MILKSNKARKIIEGGSYLVIARAVSVISGMCLVIAFTNLTEKELFGSFRYLISILGVLSLFSLTEINTAIVRAVAGGKEIAYLNGRRARFKAGIAAAIIAAVIGLSFLRFNWNADVGKALIFVIPLLPFYYALDSSLSYLNGKSYFKALACFRAGFALITFASVFFGIYLFPQNFVVICFLYVASAAFLYLVSTIYVRRFADKLCPEEDDGNVVRFGTHLSMRAMLAGIELQADSLFVGSFFTMSQLAVFSVGRMFNDQMREFSRIIQNLLLPGFSEKNRVRGISIVQLMIIMTLLFSVLSAVLIVLIPWLIPLLFTSAYSESIHYAKVFCLIQPIGISGGIIETEFVSQGRIEELYLVRILVPIVYFLAFIFLVPNLGINGILYALVIRATFFSGICIYLRFVKKRDTQVFAA